MEHEEIPMHDLHREEDDQINDNLEWDDYEGEIDRGEIDRGEIDRGEIDRGDIELLLSTIEDEELLKRLKTEFNKLDGKEELLLKRLI